MGIAVLILGESGSGKTFSTKTLPVEKTGIFSVEKTVLPYRSTGVAFAGGATYAMISASFKKAQMLRYVIDDSQYLLVNDLFDRVKEPGYSKFTDFALHFRDLIHSVQKLPADSIVYFMHHCTTDPSTGLSKAKTVGKMLDDTLVIEGCFPIVFHTRVVNNEYRFVTQSRGAYTAKTPEGMFDEIEIPNDLGMIDNVIRDYYGLQK